jgi:O-6-methylguanine DNA methyltransferase
MTKKKKRPTGADDLGMPGLEGFESVEALQAVRALRRLPRISAPPTLLPAVMSRVGLAESYWRIESPIGVLFVAAGPSGVSFVRKTDSAVRFEREFRRRHGRTIQPGRGRAPRDLVRAIARLDSRASAAGRIRFDLRGLTAFEQVVLRKALEIPPGEVRPYGWVAREIGCPEAVRAAGSALAKNPVPILIPCHRVVRSDCSVGQYVFGTRAKRALLQAEGAHPAELSELAAAGVRFLGNEQRRFFCFPTCGGFDHLTAQNRVRFRSANQALSAGYHPCEDCRPVAIAS